MQDVIRIVKQRLEELKAEEEKIRDRVGNSKRETDSHEKHLIAVVKLRAQCEEALKRLES